MPTVSSSSRHPKMTNTEKSLWLIYRNLLGIDDIDISDSFFSLGGHSLLVVRLTERIEQIIGKKVPASFVYQHPTVKDLARELDKLGVAMKYSPMVNLQPFGKDIPFFFIHGDDSNYILPRLLGETKPFYAFFHQGQDGSRLKYRTIESISSVYLDEILKLDHVNSMVLGGYSIGGLIAFEIACRLQLMGRKVLKLILLDTLAPETIGHILSGEHTYNSDLSRFVRVPQALSVSADGNSFRRLSRSIDHHLGKMIRRIRIRYFVSADRIVPLKLRNDYIMAIYRKARTSYKSSDFSGDMVLFRSTINNYDIYDLGWKKFIKGKIDIHQIRSDHQTIIKLPAIQEVGETIKNILDNCSG